MNLADIPKLVINLPHRKERLMQFDEQFRHISQGEDYEIIPGVLSNSPKQGIAEAHMNAISYAKSKGWANVMVFEDDVLFQAKNKTVEYAQNALYNAPDKWDVLLGGVYETKSIKEHSFYWSKIGQFCGLHCYIVNESFYNKFLSYKGPNHIDRWLNFSGENDFYVTNKFFAIQSVGFSDNVNREADYTSKLKKFKLL